MKRAAAAAFWLLLFAALGAAALPLDHFGRAHVWLASPRMAGAGAAVTLDLYLFLLFFGVLPGLRRAGPPPPLGPAQAVWALAGFLAMIGAGTLGTYNILIGADLILAATGAGWHADLAGDDATLATILGGETAAVLWISWYLSRVGPAQLTNGSAAGIAWRPAKRGAYAAATACAVLIIAVVCGLIRVFPPRPDAVDNLPMEHLLAGGGWELLPLLLVVTLIGPVAEELVFRGAAFAGFARRCGPAWASLLTTAIFMAVHAGEKIHYPPGFIDVGLMAAAACWLRLRYASIRPGIALHIFYNAGLIFASGLAH